MIDPKTIQRSLKERDFYRGPIDGELRSPSIGVAIKNYLDNIYPESVRWPASRRLVAYQQELMRQAGLPVGKVDGLKGPQTLFALEKWQDRLRNVPGPFKQGSANPRAATKWPTQAMVPKFYGSVGKNQVSLVPPYQMYLYDTRQKVRTITCHAKVKDSASRVLSRVLEVYGPKQIHTLRLDRFFGCLNVRKMRGGNKYSMHAWGIALDIDANRNPMRMGRDKAPLARPIYNKWWDCWEAEGWISLGRERNYDWHHVQAARL